jgi:hypothetical protein
VPPDWRIDQVIKYYSMKGFTIKYKEEVIKMGVKEGTSTIHVFDQNGTSQSYIGLLDNSSNETHIWHNFITLDKDDSIEIELVELEENSPPSEIAKMAPQPATKSKFEMFLELEKTLKEKGLL